MGGAGRGAGVTDAAAARPTTAGAGAGPDGATPGGCAAGRGPLVTAGRIGAAACAGAGDTGGRAGDAGAAGGGTGVGGVIGVTGVGDGSTATTDTAATVAVARLVEATGADWAALSRTLCAGGTLDGISLSRLMPSATRNGEFARLTLRRRPCS